MSEDAQMSAASSTRSNKRIVVPKVWKRPHSTIYGKNVEFGSKLTSDKLGELDSRKFNTDLPASWRSTTSSAASSNSPATNNGYLLNNENLLRTRYGLRRFDNNLSSRKSSGDSTNVAAPPSLFARKLVDCSKDKPKSEQRIDFYEQLGEFYAQLEASRANNCSALNNALLTRKSLGENTRLDFDYECGVFVPSSAAAASARYSPSSSSSSYYVHQPSTTTSRATTINTTTTSTHSSPLNAARSLYGQSADGRKLSLGSIKPASYRPSVPTQRSSVAHSTDCGEQFEFQDKSSPFYTDRWAGRTIRHFDADLYSNAHLFKTMIL